MLEMALELGAKEVAHMFMLRNLSVAIDRNWNFDIWRRIHNAVGCERYGAIRQATQDRLAATWTPVLMRISMQCFLRFFR